MFNELRKSILLFINRSDSYIIRQLRKLLPVSMVNQISDYEYAELKTELMTTIALNEREMNEEEMAGNKNWIGIENRYEGGGDRLGGETDPLS